MSAATVALAFLALVALFAAVPARSAYRSGSLYWTDIALVVAPAPVFLFVLSTFNKPAQIGWAAIIYPLLLVAGSVAALYVRVLALPRLGFTAKGGSAGGLAIAVCAAAMLGALVAPWYD